MTAPFLMCKNITAIHVLQKLHLPLLFNAFGLKGFGLSSGVQSQPSTHVRFLKVSYLGGIKMFYMKGSTF